MLGKLKMILSLFTPARPELSVLDVAALLHWPRSTVYRLLSKIERAEFLDRDGVSGDYRLGIRLAVLGDLATRSTSLQRLALPAMRRLSEETGETATLLLLEGGEGVAVNHVESNLPVMMKGALGRYWPLHASAGGKVFLAWLPEAQRRELLERSLEKYTATTISDLGALERELAQARQRKFTIVRGEFIEHVWGVGAPVRNHRGELEAAITLGGPRSRVTPARLPILGRATILACESVSRALGYHGDDQRADDPHAEPRRGNGAQPPKPRASGRHRSPRQADPMSVSSPGPSSRSSPRTPSASAPRTKRPRDAR